MQQPSTNFPKNRRNRQLGKNEREIIFLSLNHANTISFIDDGVDREGQPGGQRQALLRYLAKRTEVDGKFLPSFRLAAPPEMQLPSVDGLPSFDEVLKDANGDWLLPTERWLSVRAERIGRSRERAQQAAESMRQSIGSDVASSLGALLAHAQDTKRQADVLSQQMALATPNVREPSDETSSSKKGKQ